jgi:hypothetical protein
MQVMSLVETVLKRMVQEWQLWVLDEGMVQAMFLVEAVLQGVQQWQPWVLDEGMMQAMSLIETVLKGVVQE